MLQVSKNNTNFNQIIIVKIKKPRLENSGLLHMRKMKIL